MRRLIKSHIVLYAVVLMFIFTATLFVLSMIIYNSTPSTTTRAESTYAIASSEVDSSSRVEKRNGVSFFNVRTIGNGSSLYSLSDDTSSSVLQFVGKNPSLDGVQALIPDDIKNIQLVRRLSDADTNVLRISQLPTDNTHYYFQQVRCGNVPIYGAYMQVHVNKGEDVYAISGALSQEEAECIRNITRDAAEKIAAQRFLKMYPSTTQKISQSSEYIYDTALFDEGASKLTLVRRIEVCSDTECYIYYVDLKTGEIVHETQAWNDAKSRDVGNQGSSGRRTEGGAASTNTDINKVYDILGQVYDFYMNTYQRDSFDTRGSTIRATIMSCGDDINAYWTGSQIMVCSSTIALDVLVHEFTHAVTQYTSGLDYEYEIGALNESISDIFGATADTDDWLMGEDTVRAIRDFQNPGRFRNPATVSDTNYLCATGAPSRGNDNGGVHVNSGVLNKAFYLMSDGGTFPAQNGCTMSGIGRDKAAKVVYKTITTYMLGKSRANYRDMYDAMLLGCADVFQADSAECKNVKAAMEAVGIDKQKSGTMYGVRCATGYKETAPTCSGTAQPTPGDGNVSPSPTLTTTPAATPTPQTTVKADSPLLSSLSLEYGIDGNVKITSDGKQDTLVATLSAKAISSLMKENGISVQSDEDDYLRGRLIGKNVLETGSFVSKSGRLINTFVSQNDLSEYSAYEVYFSPEPSLPELPFLLADVVQNSEKTSRISLSLRFQGIDRKPPATEAQLVKIGVSGGELENTQFSRAMFKVNTEGIWSGEVAIDVPEGDAYSILVKGNKHIQKKYCDVKPSEDEAGSYICKEEKISLHRGLNTFDFTSVTQLAGDINQDGAINSQDVLAVRLAIGKTGEYNYKEDVNNDGVINAVDDSLVIYTLAHRTDIR